MSKLGITPDDTIDSSLGIASGAIIIGNIVDFDGQGRPMVDFSQNPLSEPVVALTTLALNRRHLSRQVALLFSQGNLLEPVIMGVIHNPLDELIENFEITPVDAESETPFPASTSEPQRIAAKTSRDEENRVYVDGERVTIEGAEEVTFKCGKASITLTKSGKILIRGTYLLNRSSGVNRILGGSVQVN